MSAKRWPTSEEFLQSNWDKKYGTFKLKVTKETKKQVNLQYYMTNCP